MFLERKRRSNLLDDELKAHLTNPNYGDCGPDLPCTRNVSDINRAKKKARKAVSTQKQTPSHPGNSFFRSCLDLEIRSEPKEKQALRR